MRPQVTDERQTPNTHLPESEERFERFMQHLPGLAWIKELGGRYVYANDAAIEAFQSTPDTIYGQTDADLFPPAIASQFQENDQRAAQLETGLQTVEQLEHADGTMHFSLVSKFPIPSADGKPAWIGGIAIDITDYRKAEEALRSNEKLFRALASNAPVGIFQSDASGNTVFVNECWTAMTGMSAEEARGQGWARAIHPDDRERVLEEWQNAVSNGKSSESEFRFQRPDGNVTWLLGNAMPIRGDDDRLAGYIGTVVDITARKHAEIALQEADRRKDEFLAVLAHELRNPLAPIRTGLELIRLAGDDRNLVDEVRTMMERQTQQMVRLIDDLLDVSRITRGAFELRTSRVELASILRDAVETVRPFIEECEHRLTVEIPDKPIVLDADPTRLAQVVSNLLHNATKYTRRGGTIDLSAEQRGDRALVRVKDSGIGIPADMLGRIFDMFTQVDQSMERSHGGLGIGLTLARRLIEMHEGTIEAFSAGEGFGSEFTIELPMVVGRLSEADSHGNEGRTPATKRRILVADDNEQAARVLCMLLTVLGNEVRTAYDGLAAVELAASFRPDIVLLDIGMPKLNGYEAAKQIRSQPWGRDIVLAALTGWGQEEDRRRAREAGFDHHFVKPIEPAILQRLLVT